MNSVLIVKMVVICCLSCSSISAGRLQKRIISGAALSERIAGYEAIKWFVWIGHYRFVEFDKSQDWNEDLEKCGGVVLTPNTVQTSCSCMSKGWLGRVEGEWTYPLWDSERVDIVVGRSEVDPKIQTVPMIKWYFHPLCRKRTGLRQNWVSHDYMLLGSKNAFFGSADKNVKAAPVYLLQTMINAWAKINSQNLVCLMIGMGQYVSGEIKRSKTIMHSWRKVSNYKQCLEYYAKDISPNFDRDVNVTDYQTFSTWSCLSVFQYRPPTATFSQIGYGGAGDWGAPVSCDNIFFGILGHKETVSTIVFNAYHNAYEWRGEVQREFNKFYIELRERSISLYGGYHKFKQPTMKHHPFEVKPDDLTPTLYPPKTYFRYFFNGETEMKNAQARNTFDVGPLFFLLITSLTAL